MEGDASGSVDVRRGGGAISIVVKLEVTQCFPLNRHGARLMLNQFSIESYP